MLPPEPLHDPAHRCQAAQVKQSDLQLGVRHGRNDRARGGRALVGVADGEDDSGARAYESARGEEADAAVRAGDDSHAAALVRDLGGGPFIAHAVSPSAKLEPLPSIGGWARAL